MWPCSSKTYFAAIVIWSRREGTKLKGNPYGIGRGRQYNRILWHRVSPLSSVCYNHDKFQITLKLFWFGLQNWSYAGNPPATLAFVRTFQLWRSSLVWTIVSDSFVTWGIARGLWRHQQQSLSQEILYWETVLSAPPHLLWAISLFLSPCWMSRDFSRLNGAESLMKQSEGWIVLQTSKCSRWVGSCRTKFCADFWIKSLGWP